MTLAANQAGNVIGTVVSYGRVWIGAPLRTWKGSQDHGNEAESKGIISELLMWERAEGGGGKSGFPSEEMGCENAQR